jgi:hypothetical protein
MESYRKEGISAGKTGTRTGKTYSHGSGRILFECYDPAADLAETQVKTENYS